MVTNKSRFLKLTTSAVLATTVACGGGVGVVEQDSTEAATEALTAPRRATLPDWPQSPKEELTEAWLIPSQVAIRFRRETRKGQDLNGNRRPECQALVAAGAQLIVLKNAIPYPSSTTKFEVRVNDVVSTPFGGGKALNSKFASLTFSDWFRPRSGEAAFIANVPEFGITSRCSGSEDTVSQNTVITRTYQDRTTATFEGTTNLARVISLRVDEPLYPAALCETERAPGFPNGVLVERCVGAPRDPRETGYSHLSVTLSRYDMGGFAELRTDTQYNIWLSLNGVSGFYPMVCTSEFRYPVSSRTCRVTITSENRPGLLLQDSPVIDKNLFTFARRDSGRTLNAWDIQFAAVDGNGRWLNNGGRDYRGRFGERKF